MVVGRRRREIRWARRRAGASLSAVAGRDTPAARITSRGEGERPVPQERSGHEARAFPIESIGTQTTRKGGPYKGEGKRTGRVPDAPKSAIHRQRRSQESRQGTGARKARFTNKRQEERPVPQERSGHEARAFPIGSIGTQTTRKGGPYKGEGKRAGEGRARQQRDSRTNIKKSGPSRKSVRDTKHVPSRLKASGRKQRGKAGPTKARGPARSRQRR